MKRLWIGALLLLLTVLLIQANRYQIVLGHNTWAYKLDRLTGRVWVIDESGSGYGGWTESRVVPGQRGIRLDELR